MAVYQYDNLSRRHSVTRGNGTSSSFGYDLASRLTSLGHDVTGTAQDISLTFQYTLASQLQLRSGSNALYDWLPVVANTAYVPDGLNRYATVAGTAYAYDARANLTSDGTDTYTYDVENRLLTASAPTAVTLSYDPLGRLQQTMVATTPTQYLYDGANLVAEYNGSGSVLRRYVHGPGTDDPIVWYEGSTLATHNYLHADERGSVIATTDNTGAATIYTYGPYGEPAVWTGSRFRYTGQTAIPEAHLYYYKARVYSPTLGRFLQTDPIGSKDDLNLYAYASNDPTDKTDPSGLCEPDGCADMAAGRTGSKPPNSQVAAAASVTGKVADATATTAKVAGGTAKAAGATQIASVASKIEKGAGALANVATGVEAVSKAADGDVKGAVTTVAAAGVDRGVGVAVGVAVAATPAAPVAPYVGAAVSTVSSITGFGDHVAGPYIEGVSNLPTNIAGGLSHEIMQNLCPVGCGPKN